MSMPCMRLVSIGIAVLVAHSAAAQPRQRRTEDGAHLGHPSHRKDVARGDVAISVAVVLDMRRELQLTHSFFIDVIVRALWLETCEHIKGWRSLPAAIRLGDLSVLDQLPADINWIACDLASLKNDVLVHFKNNRWTEQP